MTDSACHRDGVSKYTSKEGTVRVTYENVCIRHFPSLKYSTDLLPVTETDWIEKCELTKYFKTKPTMKPYIYLIYL